MTVQIPQLLAILEQQTDKIEELRSADEVEVDAVAKAEADWEATAQQIRDAKASAARQTQLQEWTAVVNPVAGAHKATMGEDEDAGWDHWLRTGDEGGVAHLRAQSESIGSAGGFAVPESFRAKLVDRMRAFGGFAPNAENITTTKGEPLTWLTLDDVANVGNIVDENAAPGAGADLVFGERQLGAHKVMANGPDNKGILVSWELLQDSAINVEGLIADKLGMRIGRKVAALLATGTGVAEPQGIITGSTQELGTIATNGTGIDYREAVDAIHGLDPAYRTGASWVMHDSVLALIERQIDSDGRPLYLPGLSTDPSLRGGSGRLAGFPVIVDQEFPSSWAASAKTILFGNIREAYVVRTVRDVTVIRLDELSARSGQVEWLAWMRIDGAVQDPNAFGHVLAAA